MFYARSRDHGKTWTNAAETRSFTRDDGLKQIHGLPNPSYAIDFLVKRADTYGRTCVGQLSNGHAVILHGEPTGVIFSRWTGDKWVSSNVETSGYPMSIGMEVLSRDRIVVHASHLGREFGGMFEYLSLDVGKTWSETPIMKAGSSGLTNLIATTAAHPRGKSERVLLNWTGAYNRSAGPPLNHRKIFFLERRFD